MRSFLTVLPFLFSLSLASLAQDNEGRMQAVHYGRSNLPLADSNKEVEAALDVLRRANYNLDDHMAKRSESWSWKSNGNSCYCVSDSKKHKPTGGHHIAHKATHHATKHPHVSDPVTVPKVADPKPTAPKVTVPKVPKVHKHLPSTSDPLPKVPKHLPSTPATIPKTTKTPKKTCPSGYHYAEKGDKFITNENSLIDLSNLDINIDILSYVTSKAPSTSSTLPAKDSPTCKGECCCYKPTCPSGHTAYSKGDTFVKNHNNLVDLSDLDITLDILSFDGLFSKPVVKKCSASEKPTCKSSTCCVKQTTKRGSKTIENNNSLIDASGAKVKACVLSACG